MEGIAHAEPARGSDCTASHQPKLRKETFVSPRKREDFNYGREDPSPTKSYLSYNYNLPHHEEHSSYASEGTTDSSSSYQSIFQRKSSGLSSLQVQPRRAIHPERQAQAAEKALESNAETKRYLPLWLQLLVFGLLAAFLVFIYFLEGGADGNPFVKYISQ
ncbi:hypothetical protein E2320_016580 [Naja naja]|nr:hypothetical protein E2320_016580 [Naja naja]